MSQEKLSYWEINVAVDPTTLSPSQNEAANHFNDFMMDKDQKVMVIAGFAGSGKSYLVRYLTQQAIKLNQVQQVLDSDTATIAIFFTATTNKAARVLSESTGFSCQTIHSFLGLKVKNDYKTGISRIAETENTQAVRNALIIIDEASMVDKQLASIIQKYTKESKVVYIGDSYQLPPVFENGSVIFGHKNTVYLKEIQRQVAGSPIIQYSQKYRDILDQGLPITWPEIPTGVEELQQLTGPEFKAKIEERFSSAHSPSDYKILCYTNNKAISYNNFVRSLYTQSEGFIPGEKLVVNTAVTHGDSVLIASDKIVTIEDIDEYLTDDGIDCYELWLQHVNKPLLMAQNPADVNQLCKHYAKHKDWHNYFRVKETYVDLRSIHASTCHKAQGSTYKEVFIDMADIGKNNKWYEVARLAYVAITRASERVYLYGKLPNRWSK